MLLLTINMIRLFTTKATASTTIKTTTKKTPVAVASDESTREKMVEI